MKKYVLMFLVVVLLIGFTLNSVITEETIHVFLDSIKNIKIAYFFVIIVILVLYFVLQGSYMKLILKSLNTKVSLLKCTFYSMVEFYFSGITPSSTAGQPMQLYFMTKDDIPMSNSYITLILNLIYFKIIVLILGLVMLFIKGAFIFNQKTIYVLFFLLGFITDILLIVVGFLLLFHQDIIKKIFTFFIRIGKKIPYLNKKINKIDVDEILERYKNQIKYIKSHKKEVFVSFIITFIQRILFFSIAYFVYKGMGNNKLSYFDLLFIQVAVQITSEAFPIPGGTGISENLFRDLFIPLIGAGLAEVGMVFSRLFTFYIPLVCSCIVVIGYYIYLNFKSKDKTIKRKA